MAAKKKRDQSVATTGCSSINTTECANDLKSLETNFKNSLNISRTEDSSQNLQPSLVSILLVMMSVFSILNQIHYIPTLKS